MAVDWEERINFQRMRKEKNEKLKQAAKKHNVEAMLLLNGDNIRYVATSTGMHHSQAVSGTRYALLPTNGDPTLFECGMWHRATQRACPWLRVKYAIPVFGWYYEWLASYKSVNELQLKKFAEEIKGELKEQRMSGTAVSLDVSTPAIIKALENNGVGVNLDGLPVMLDARRTKTKDEVECLRMIAMIAEAAFANIKKAIKPGITEFQIRGIASETAYSLGAELVLGPEVNSGPHSWPNNAQASDRAVRPGDLVMVAFCNSHYMGYRSCYYRVFSCGRPTQGQKDAYARVRDMLYDAIKLVRPGVTTKELAEKWPKAQEFGYPDEDSAVLMQWGHGIGLSLFESPFVTRIWSMENPEKLEPNMTMAMETIWPTGETRYDYPDGQAPRLEEMIHVTEDGYDLLSRWPSDEITVCEL